MLTKALSTKYDTSSSYYYSRHIDDILNNDLTSTVVKYKDYQCWDYEDEFLKRFYKR